jgi:hypothetical protein
MTQQLCHIMILLYEFFMIKDDSNKKIMILLHFVNEGNAYKY